jgi:hypothetical protein
VLVSGDVRYMRVATGVTAVLRLAVVWLAVTCWIYIGGSVLRGMEAENERQTALGYCVKV